jgi:hypothetical protein
MKVVGIIGLDRCGSTVLARLLEMLKGARTAGECHWLVDAPASGKLSTRIRGWQISRQCVVHGDACPIFKPDFVFGPHRPNTLYSDVGLKMGASTLISTDKTPRHFRRFVPSGGMTGVVLHKRPEQAFCSAILGENMTAEDAAQKWVSFYWQTIKWAPGFCKDVIYLSYEDVIERPWRILRVVGEAIDAEVIPGPLHLRSNYHFFGGNLKAHRSKGLVADRRWLELQKAGKLTSAAEHPKVREVYNRLRRLRSIK